ncbi:MAG: hypothetical protein GF383_09860 [Candidatus Lokiarchaeota archaeon]|nr:hypothetical protein [Candidatus Lokiarchaeota archaeon]MBD3340829.1 hypothetical protein [Candidatus Lokiarchaeota archaeon]
MPVIEVKYTQLVFNPEVQKYCLNPKFKCPNYDQSWACPPAAPYLEKELSRYKRFFLIYSELNLEDYVEKEKVNHPKRSKEKILNRLFWKENDRNDLEREINNFLAEFPSDHEEKIVLWGGHCNLCEKRDDKQCSYPSGAECQYPNEIRYSMEAIGINVDETIKNLNLGLNLEWPPKKYIRRFGLVCFK